MDITYYTFAFYVFLLVWATIWVYGRVMRRSKTKNGGEEKERQLFRLYQNIEDMLGGFEEYAEETKTSIDERLKQAEALIERMNAAQAEPGQEEKAVENTERPDAEPDHKNRPEKQGAVSMEAETAPANRPEMESPKQSGKSRENSRRSSGKPRTEDLISKYVAQGIDTAEIARILGKSQREVSLMMEIKK